MGQPLVHRAQSPNHEESENVLDIPFHSTAGLRAADQPAVWMSKLAPMGVGLLADGHLQLVVATPRTSCGRGLEIAPATKRRIMADELYRLHQAVGWYPERTQGDYAHIRQRRSGGRWRCGRCRSIPTYCRSIGGLPGRGVVWKPRACRSVPTGSGGPAPSSHQVTSAWARADRSASLSDWNSGLWTARVDPMGTASRAPNRQALPRRFGMSRRCPGQELRLRAVQSGIRPRREPSAVL